MPIRYWEPLEEAVSRTRGLLFRPFDLGRWFVLGFTAWLVHLGDFGGSAAGSNTEIRHDISDGDWSGLADTLANSAHDIVPAGLAFTLIVAMITAALMIALVLLWVSCRARFVWLENLTAGDHAVGSHWRRYGHLGNGFFLWKLAFYALSLLLFGPLVAFGGVFGILGISGFDGPGSAFGWALLGMAFFVVTLVLTYIDFFADSFVTVIMHRRGAGVMAAWREFRSLFEDRPGHFILVGLVKLMLTVAATVGLIIAGVATCCVGLGLMALPYIGAVVKLPVLAALRYYDLCWLGQFGEDLALPATAMVTPAGSTPDSGPTP